MHMILRTLWAFFRKRWLAKAQINEMTEITMTVLPTDLDLLWHVNNGVYFSFMDFGRWDMIFRNGVYDLSMKKGWYSVVAGETIKFRRSLKLWDRFSLQTKIIGYDEKYFFIQQKFICKGELMATGMVKVRFLRRKGGTVSVAEVMNEFNWDQLENTAQELSSEWFKIDQKYLA